MEWPTGRGIAFKEMLAVVLSAAVWGREWSGTHVRGHCDEAIMHMVTNRHSKNPELMHLLCCLFFIEAEHSFTLSLAHIAGVDNDLADDLLRNNLSSFLAKVPLVSPLLTRLPPALVEHQLDTDGT